MLNAAWTAEHRWCETEKMPHYMAFWTILPHPELRFSYILNAFTVAFFMFSLSAK